MNGKKLRLMIAAALICLTNSSYAELWHCANGSYKSNPSPGENCAPVKAGVQCGKGQRTISSKVDGIDHCAVKKVVKVYTKSLMTPEYGRADLQDASQPVIPSFNEKRAYGHGPVYDQIMDESMSNSRRDWGEVVERIDRGEDPFPDGYGR